MAKILKSSAVVLESARPVILAAGCLMAGASDAGHAGTDGRNMIESRTAAIMAEARAEAACLLEQAGREAEALRTQAWNEGYSQGRQTASQELASIKTQLREAFDARFEALECSCQAELDAMQEDLLELSLQIAEKIIGLELSRNEFAFIALVNDAMSRFKQGDKVAIKVSKNDYWRSLVSSSYAAAGMAETVSLLADETLPDGSCLVESPAGAIDASVPTQLGKIREAMIAAGPEV